MTDTWAPEDLRGYAFAVAYRMLGSVSEAEDVVQEAMLRLHAADRSAVRSPTAYTATVTTRLALDELRSARVRRERYVGPWLPAPILGEPGPGREELVRSLAEAGLVDEYRLMVAPVLLGRGRRLFGPQTGALRLVECVPTTTGVLISRYAPA